MTTSSFTLPNPAAKRPALGRGLSALIPPRPASAPGPSAAGSMASAPLPNLPGLLTLGVELIHPSKSQPRKTFDEATMEELAASIREHGILQPVVVRRTAANAYEIVAGERRWRAAQRAGLKDIPAVLKDVASNEVLTLALVENLQRQDLNPIEEAEAYRNLIDDLGLTQEDVASRVGKDRATVANALRLLKLPDQVRELVMDGKLSMGHARALLSLADGDQAASPDALLRAAREVMARDLSVRATEAMVRARKTPAAAANQPELADRRAAAHRELEDQLRQRLACKVSVHERDGKGSITLAFHSLDELDALLVRLGVK